MAGNNNNFAQPCGYGAIGSMLNKRVSIETSQKLIGFTHTPGLSGSEYNSGNFRF